MSELLELTASRDEILDELAQIDNALESGVKVILEAIKNQRWYFFKNNKYILLDRDTGILWANLDYFPYSAGDLNPEFERASGFSGWGIPTASEMESIARDNKYKFPFRDTPSSPTIKSKNYWRISRGDRSRADGDINLNTMSSDSNPTGYLIPCTYALVHNSTYAQDVRPSNYVYSEEQRLNLTLKLFTDNNLWPKFTDESATELFGKIYIDYPKRKPELSAKLSELESQIESLQAVKLLSSEFDYTAKLADYDLNAINSSVIKYFKALQSWTDSLMGMVEVYEREKEQTISSFNMITLQLSKKYEDSPDLTSEENNLLRERIEFFRRRLSLGMNRVKAKILAVKTQADDLESRIDSTDSIIELGRINREDRAGFELIAENTARIITASLLKIEYFEEHQEFVVNAVKILSEWTEDYRVFKTTGISQLKESCVKDVIDARIWDEWCKDWQALRFGIEQKLQPMLERGLKGDIAVSEEESESRNIAEQVIAVLKEYKSSLDNFYLEERKGIYQKFAFVPGGSLQEKFECESMLYRCTSKFQSDLQRIIFSCTSPADRIFILNWADSLLDIQIDEILAFVADSGLDKISGEILDEFAKLKLKNYDVYLSDAKAYGEELSRREKQYNSLMFRMRSDLAREEAK